MYQLKPTSIVLLKIKPLLLVLLAVMSLGCTQTPLMAPRNVDSPNTTKAGDLPPKRGENNKPAGQQKLTTILHQLTITSEPESFAKQHGLSFLRDKVKVFIYFTPDASSSERQRVINAHDIQVEKKANDLVSAWVSVNRLGPLTKEPVVRFISQPKILKKADGIIDE
jgi:hypothetical protein